MTIVVGYIPGPMGEAALAHAVTEARRSNARLVLVNATRGDAYVDTRFAEHLESVRAQLDEAGLDYEVRQPMGADIADLILQAAEDTSADLIVVGLRHRTPVGKLFLGSTAQRVLLDAACPVLAVKAASAS